MAIGSLRIPVKVAESYVRPGDEARLFSNFPDFLSQDEVYDAFPAGIITHEVFRHNGNVWRLVKRLMSNGNNVFLAVLDEAHANGNGPAVNGHNTPYATPDMAQRLRSLPLDSFPTELGDVGTSGSGTDITPPYLQQQHQYGHQHQHSLPPHPSQHSMHAAASAPGPLSAQPSMTHRNGSIRDRNGSYNCMMALAGPQNGSGGLMQSMSTGMGGGPGAGNTFVADLLAATESPLPVERYKAFVRLFSGLSRSVGNMGLPSTELDNRKAAGHPAWDAQDAQDLVRQIVMVGECLNKFPTTEFEGQRNNTTRAITAKDFDSLVRMYIQRHGSVYQDAFIGRMPLPMQDDMIATRTLLETRYTTNDALFTALLKSVGQEPTSGGAMVFNTTAVNANPVNHMLAAPRTLVNTVSNAWSKADVKRRSQMGAIGAVAVVALLVIKRKLFGGGGGGEGRGRRGGRDESEWGSGGRRGSRSRGSGDLAGRLLDERSTAERMAVRYLAACQDELRRAAQNDALLRTDWRLGPLRLAPPGSGPVPSGYEPVQTGYCSVAAYMNALDSGAPYGMTPYGLPDRPPTGSMRESAASSVPSLE